MGLSGAPFGIAEAEDGSQEKQGIDKRGFL